MSIRDKHIANATKPAQDVLRLYPLYQKNLQIRPILSNLLSYHKNLIDLRTHLHFTFFNLTTPFQNRYLYNSS